jgi:hypothetical protein
MCNILISLGKPATSDLLDAIMVALASGWGTPTVTTAGTTTVISFDSESVEANPIPSPDTEMPSPEDFVAVATLELPPAPVEDPSTTVALGQEPALIQQTTIELPNVIIKSLSLTTQIKALFDSSISTSVLKVAKDKTRPAEQGFEMFMFGGMSYRYPLSDGLINVVVAFTDSDSQQFSTSLTVCSNEDTGIEEIVFGSADAEKLAPYLSV